MILKRKNLRFFLDLKFAIGILFFIAIFSSLGSILEQDQPTNFYLENYKKPIYGFINYSFILFFGLDHIYHTWWFLSLLAILGISLISCTIVRQFPLAKISKSFYFKKELSSFKNLPFFIKFKKIYYLEQKAILQLQKVGYFLYQRKNFSYGYKGLVGRISPILVHLSLILLLISTSLGTILNFQSQEIIPKGEIFRIQNFPKIGFLTSSPKESAKVNDFWIEYKQKNINKFYSDISIVENLSGKELIRKTVSVNNPLKWKGIYFYQTDWNLKGLRVKNSLETNKIEYPLFLLRNNNGMKSWVTWIKGESENLSIIFQEFDYSFFVYGSEGNFIAKYKLDEYIDENILIVEIIPTTGLLIKYDPTLPFIYLAFGLLIVTTLLSYYPYNQIWISNSNEKFFFIGSTTNRGKIQLEIEFENFLRISENFQRKTKKTIEYF